MSSHVFTHLEYETTINIINKIAHILSAQVLVIQELPFLDAEKNIFYVHTTYCCVFYWVLRSNTIS